MAGELSSTIQTYRLQCSTADSASGNLATLLYDLPFYDEKENASFFESRDILALLPHGDIESPQEFPIPLEPPNSCHTNPLMVQELRRLRRSRHPYPQVLKLDHFLHQPFDIQVAVLEFCHPLDIKSLSKTCKSLRSFLLHPSSQPLWMASFQTHTSVLPPMPENVTAMRWMDLLFGDTLCDSCGGGNSFTDFVWKSRLCEGCRNIRFLDPRPSLREFIVGSLVTGAQKYTVPCLSRGKAPIVELLKLRSAIEAIQDTPQALEDFQETRRNFVQKDIDHAELCNAWRDSLEASFCFEWVSLRDIIIDKVNKRLVLHGFDPRDVRACQSDLRTLFQLETPSGRWIRNSKLTESMWIYARVHIEPRLLEVKASRISRALRKRIDSRENDIFHGYTKYFRPNLVSPWLWPEIPPAFAVFKHPAFSHLINNNVEVDLDDERHTNIPMCSIRAAFDQLVNEGWIDDWRWKKMKELASYLPSYNSTSLEDADPTTLDRATSVFWCLGSRYGSYTAGRCLLGWEGAAPHLRCGALRSSWGGRLHFNERGAAAARECVRMTGLWTEKELEAVTAAEMDALDRRFLCAQCEPKDFGNFKGRAAMTWRECVSHAIDKLIDNDTLHKPAPSFLLLSPKSESHVKSREHPEPTAKHKAWTCNHCNVHCGQLVTKEVAIRHLKESHFMSAPVQNLDFVYFAHAIYRSPRTPVTFQESPPLEYECTQCQAAGHVIRLYCATQIQGHLSRKHDLCPVMQLGRDILKLGSALWYSEPPTQEQTAEDITRHHTEIPLCETDVVGMGPIYLE